MPSNKSAAILGPCLGATLIVASGRLRPQHCIALKFALVANVSRRSTCLPKGACFQIASECSWQVLLLATDGVNEKYHAKGRASTSKEQLGLYIAARIGRVERLTCSSACLQGQE